MNIKSKRDFVCASSSSSSFGEKVTIYDPIFLLLSLCSLGYTFWRFQYCWFAVLYVYSLIESLRINNKIITWSRERKAVDLMRIISYHLMNQVSDGVKSWLLLLLLWHWVEKREISKIPWMLCTMIYIALPMRTVRWRNVMFYSAMSRQVESH